MIPIYATFTPESISSTFEASSISATFTEIYNIEDMKYLTSTTLTAGEETDITTTLTTKPYSIEIFDASGTCITEGLLRRVELSGGFYHLYIYSTDAVLIYIYIIY